MLHRNQRVSYVKRLMTISCRGAIIRILLCIVIILFCEMTAFSYLKGKQDTEKRFPLINQYDMEVTSPEETIDLKDPQEDQAYLEPLSKLINAETQVSNFTNKNEHLHADVEDEIKTDFPPSKDTLEETQTTDDPARSHVTKTQLVLNKLERYTSTENSNDADEKGNTTATANIDSDVKSVLGIQAENEHINVITHQYRTADAHIESNGEDNNNNSDKRLENRFRDTKFAINKKNQKLIKGVNVSKSAIDGVNEASTLSNISRQLQSKKSPNREDNNNNSDKRLDNRLRDTKFAINKKNQKLIKGVNVSKSAIDGVNEASTLSNNSRQHQSKKSTNRESEVKVLSNKRIVIVLAYMRTGSTLTASLLQEYKNTFYVFEPLAALIRNDYKYKKTKLKYISGTLREYETSMLQEVALNEIRSWLTCQIGNISERSLTIPTHTRFTKFMKNFNVCYDVAKKQKSQYDINQCLKTVTTMCRKAPLLVLKFIRLRMSEILKLLPYFPNMKVLHLVRDPRGILNSRERVDKYFHYQKNVLKLCDSTQKDLTITKTIQQKYPGRIKILFYEDMAERPLDTAKAISEFSGIEFTDHMKSYIISQTSSEHESCNYCTARANSTMTANKWRLVLDPKHARFVYKTCESSNKYLGYLPFTSNVDQQNLNIPSRKRLDKNDLMLNG